MNLESKQQEDRFYDSINGNFDNPPLIEKRVIRIFLSSTFTDTTEERNYLIENIFPRLNEYCKLKHGLFFQFVDMRWGIQNDAYENHGTTELCIKEILNCQNVSLGPNFVSLIGQKYGLRPLPTILDQNEFEIIKNQLGIKHDLSATHIDEDGTISQISNVLDSCYKLDKNSKPFIYRLIPISKIIENFNASESKKKFWDLIQSKLSQLLRQGADLALEKNLISREQRERYFISITEKEIFEGMLNPKINFNINKSCSCFIREIVNLEEHLNDSNAPRFIDLIKENNSSIKIDSEAEKLIENLKNVKIPYKLDSSNIFYYKVKWKNNQIDKDELNAYLKKFGIDFFNQMIRLIEDAFKTEQVKNAISNEIYFKFGLINERDKKFTSHEMDLIQEFKDLILELSNHATEFRENNSKYFGRDYLTVKIKNYIFNDSQLPFVVTGESGCGKTHLMAYVHKQIPEWVPDPQNYSIITRFLGTTAKSSSIFKTYLTIALQLHYLLNYLSGSTNTKNYDTLSECKNVASLTEFILKVLNEIKRIDFKRKIIILADSLDQLIPNDYNNVNKWLITELPSHVKLIVSTIPNHGNLLALISKLITKKLTQTYLTADSNSNLVDEMIENQILRVKQLEKSESEIILRNWLTKANHFLTDEQWTDLRVIFEKGKLFPLFLELLFDHVKDWRSYDRVDDEFLKFVSVDQIIIYMFKALEKLHGTTIFKRAICYMTVLKNGISDSELEDILSLDDDVLFSIFQFHLPPIRRLPSILWVRIKNDLRKYIVEKEANDTKVIFWYHRRFVQVALDKYVRTLDKKETETIFQNIFDFYNETWKGKQKPFELNDYLKKKMKINSQTETHADRYISSQPIEYIAENGVVHYNKRKLTELPNCLTSITNHFGLIKSCELVFYNYEFMHAKLVCDSLAEIDQDLTKLLTASSAYSSTADEETKQALESIEMFKSLMNLCGDIVNDYPDSFAFQVSSRLLTQYGLSKHVTNLIDQADLFSPKHCGFISPYSQQQPPGGLIMSVIQKHKEPIQKLMFLNNFVITYSLNQINVMNLVDSKFKHLFEIRMPALSNLMGKEMYEFYLNNAKIQNEDRATFRCYFYIEDLGKISSMEEEILENPDLFPAMFLITRGQLVYMIASNKELKFLYHSRFEILDAFCLGNKEIILVEKDNTKIKIFFNLDLKQMSELTVSSDKNNFIKQLSSNVKKLSLELLITLTNGEIRQYYIQNEKHSIQEPYTSDSSDFESHLLPVTNDASLMYYEKFKLNHLQIILNTLIRPTGLNIVNCLKSKSSTMIIVDKRLRAKPSRFYLTSNEGDFIIMRRNFICVFKTFTKEPVIEVKSCRTESNKSNKENLFIGSLRTNKYCYLVHPVQIDGKRTLCKYKIKDKIDFVQMLSEKLYILCREGVLEIFKLSCLKNYHRVKLVYSVHCNSKQITDVICAANHLFCTTINGSLNLIRAFTGDISLPIFDRAYMQIQKIYVSLKTSLTYSLNNEFVLWDITNGKIIKRINLNRKNESKKQIKIKYDFPSDLLVMLNPNGILTIFKNFELIKKQEIFKQNPSDKLILMNCSELSNEITITEIKSLQIFELKCLDQFITVNSQSFENKINTKDKLIIVLKPLKVVLLVENDLKKFQYVTYDQNQKLDLSRRRIRFLNGKHEKEFRKFSANNKIIKFKVLNVKKSEFWFIFSSLKTNTIINAKILTSNDNQEMEIVQLFSFCSSYLFRTDQNQEIFLCIYQEDDEKRSVKLLKTHSNQILLELTFNNFNSNLLHMSWDSNYEYFVYFDQAKLLWLYRIKDATKLACLPLYGNCTNIKFNQDDRFVVLSMDDRRLFCLLVVDFANLNHQNRIKELKSRSQLKETKQLKKDNNIQNLNNLHTLDILQDHSEDDTNSSDDLDFSIKVKTMEDNQNGKFELDESSDNEEDKQNSKNKVTFVQKEPIEFPFNVKIDSKKMLKHNWLNEILIHESIEKDLKDPNKNENFLENLSPTTDNQTDQDFLKQLHESLTNKKNSKSITTMNSGLKVKVTNSSGMCLLS